MSDSILFMDVAEDIDINVVPLTITIGSKASILVLISAAACLCGTCARIHDAIKHAADEA
jgi:hypothetical protein